LPAARNAKDKVGEEGSNTLNLLTVNRVVRVTFTPPLSTIHYEELHEIGRKCEYDYELKAAVADAANRWGVSVNFG
jgi:hypothetical protein